MAIWTTNPAIYDDTRGSRGVNQIPQRNVEWLVQALRRWPGLGRYAQASGYSGAGAFAEGVLAINYPEGKTYPIWAGGVFKTPGRDLLSVSLLARTSATSRPYRLDIRINNILAEQITVTSTGFVSVAGNYAIGAGNGYGVIDGDYYTVVIMATNVSSTRGPGFFTSPMVEGYASTPPAGFPTTLPTFTGAGDLDPDDANTVISGLSWLFGRVAAHKRVGLSGVTQNFFDAASSMAGEWLRAANYSVRVLPGHRTVRIRGRYEHRGGQTHDMRIVLNGMPIWTETNLTGPQIREPWELDIDVSAVPGLTLVDGSVGSIGVDYRQVTDISFPRPRITLAHVSLDGAASVSGYAYQTAPAVGVGFDIRPYLQQLRNNVAAAKQAYDAVAVQLERDIAYSWQWDTPTRYAYHPQAQPDRLGRLRRARYNGPAYFHRWGDVLHVYGVRPRIVWGPTEYSYTMEGNSQEIAELRQPYEFVIDDDPERAVKTTIYLDAVEVDGARLAGTQRYSVQADALYYAAESVLDRQVL